jgi:hypothetical protein
MRAMRCLICLLACLSIAGPTLAQEGHPLKGTWVGDWGPSKDHRNPVTVFLDWDGKNITGIINPGPEAIPIQKAQLTPKGWLVHWEADAKDRSGKTVHYVIDGHIEDLGLYYPSIVGTWNQDNEKGNFKVTRQ